MVYIATNHSQVCLVLCDVTLISD